MLEGGKNLCNLLMYSKDCYKTLQFNYWKIIELLQCFCTALNKLYVQGVINEIVNFSASLGNSKGGCVLHYLELQMDLSLYTVINLNYVVN